MTPCLTLIIMLNSRRINGIILFLTFSIFQSAQVLDSTQYMYAGLPDELFPKGFLHDQSLLRLLHQGSGYDLHLYDGSIPGKLVTKRHGELAYNDLYLSQRLNNGLLFGTKPPLLKPWAEFEKQSHAQDTLGVDVSLYLNWFDVHELDSNAISNGWLSFDNDQVQLMPQKIWLDQQQSISWNTPSPLDSAKKAIQLFNVFFGGTNSAAHYVNSNQVNMTFSLMDYLVQSNQLLPEKFYLDLDDGQGFRQVVLNQKIQTSYSTTSLTSELVYKDLAIRIRHHGTWLETRFRIPIIFNVDTPDQLIHTDSLPSPVCFPTLSPAHDASITVKFANKGLGLQKPVVLVEGFESSLEPYGIISYQGISSGIILNENDEQVFFGMAKLAWLYDSLHSSGYDIVHVDFRESKQGIVQNSHSLIRALQWVKSQQADNPAIVVGASMGGLIARAALLELERSDCFLDINAYGTFDTPHDGAFVPLGIQMGAKRMEELTTFMWKWSIVETWSKALNSLTARQLLIDHLDPSASYDRAQIEKLYNNEQPKTVRRFAISNGSDLQVSAPLDDPDDIIAQWGKKKHITYKHRVNTHIDSLRYNKSGGDKRNVLSYGASIEGMNSSSDFLYYGQNIFRNTLNFQKLKHVSAFGSIKALWTKRLVFWSIINSSKGEKAILSIQQQTNSKLAAIHHRIKQKASSLEKESYFHNYIEISGSSTNSAKAFERMLWSEVKSPTHTFIPAFSALNVGETFADKSFRGRMDLIPFHSYISPGLIDEMVATNQEHIYTDESIIDFTLRSFEGIYQVIGENGILKTNFNIAKTNNAYSSYPSHIFQLKVPEMLELRIGNQGFVGSSSVAADPDQHIEVFLGNGFEPGYLLVEGKLKIGDLPGHNSTLRINKGSTLTISKNGTLYIGHGSQLIIEKGAKLRLEPGSIIEWNSGTIKVEGLIDLDSGASFTPAGIGTIVFTNEGRFSPLSTGSLHIQNSNIEVKNIQHLPVNLHSVQFDECKLTFFEQGELKVRSEFNLWNTSIQYNDIKHWAGLSVSGNSTDIQHCEFIGGNPALTVHSNVDFTISNSDFKLASCGINCTATPKKFYANTFSICQTGANLNSGSMTIDRNLFYQCDVGLVFRPSVKNTGVNLMHNVFTSNVESGSQFENTILRMECNEWRYNSTGHSQFGGSILMGSNAGNTFTSNSSALEFDLLSNLNMNNGHNQFSGNNSIDIKGTFHPNAAVPYNGSHHYIAADYTGFSGPNSTGMSIERDKVYIVKSPNTKPSSLVCPAKGPKKISNSEDSMLTEMKLHAFPNPTSSGYIELSFNSLNGIGVIEIFDIKGIVIGKHTLESGIQKKSLLVSNTPGTYVVKLTTQDGIESVRVVVL